MDANGDLSAPESELLIEAWKQQQVLAGVEWDEAASGMKERMKAIHFISSKNRAVAGRGRISSNTAFLSEFHIGGLDSI
jgi:hypothetical protein